MLARSLFRSAQPLKQSIRHYATPPGPASSSSNAALYSAITIATLGGGGYYYYNRTLPTSASAPPSASERKTIPSTPAPSVSAPQTAAFTGGDQGFIDLKLDSVSEINHNTKKFRFALPNSDDVSGLQIASALITKYKGPGMEKPVIRPYTPVSDEDQLGFIDLVVKRYPGGPMSEHLHSMEPEQRLEFKGPVPKYQWEENKHEHIALIAGGTGITPMYQLARAIFKNPSDKTRVTLIFGNLTEPDILLKRELEDLENTYPQRFRAFYLLDQPPEGWTQGSGHVTKELLKTVLPEPKEGGKVKIFVCGPPGMYKAVSGVKKSPQDQGELTGMLRELGYQKEQVYKF
ncbi:NADH-cytochrome b5 reductase [Lecanora helva]